MPMSPLSEQEIMILEDVFINHIPFNKVLGLHIEIDRAKPEQARVTFNSRDDLIGNPIQHILHGGVISSTLDVVGGLAACMGMILKMEERTLEQFKARFARMGTIDLRVDYLRPGRGEHFNATGYTLRTGNKVAVTRMELHNEHDVLIAAGTGTYLIG